MWFFHFSSLNYLPSREHFYHIGVGGTKHCWIRAHRTLELVALLKQIRLFSQQRNQDKHWRNVLLCSSLHYSPNCMDVNQCPCWCPPSVQGKEGKRESGLKESTFDLALSEWQAHSVHSGKNISISWERSKVEKGQSVRRRTGEKWPAAMMLSVT